MDVPVVVAGGGPVGLAEALLLARAGVASVVCEARPRREPIGSRSICTHGDVLSILDRAGGCGRVLAAEGVTWTEARTYHRGRELFRVALPAVDGGGHPPFVNISQSRVEDVLAGACRAEPLIELRYGCPVTGVAQDGGGVTVATGRGRLRAGHLVGADGHRSAVRAALGVAFEGESSGERFLIADIRAELPFGRQRRFHFDPEWNPGRQVLVHPQPGGVWRVDWQVPASFDLDAAVASGEVDERIRRIAGGTRYEIVWLSSYRFAQRSAAAYVCGRVLLAGDAAHVMAPFGARGLNSGIADAENAAWKIAAVASGTAGPGLLAAYGDERRAAAAENLRVTAETMRFLVPPDAAAREHRRRVLDRAGRDPSARARVDSGRLYEPFVYAASPLTTPYAPGSPVPPGGLCPDAAYRDGRLRDRFGPGFTLLAHGVDPPVIDDPVPVTGLRLDDATAAGLPPDAFAGGRMWLVRPDGHLAAVADTPPAVASALRRACGWT